MIIASYLQSFLVALDRHREINKLTLRSRLVSKRNKLVSIVFLPKSFVFLAFLFVFHAFLEYDVLWMFVLEINCSVSVELQLRIF